MTDKKEPQLMEPELFSKCFAESLGDAAKFLDPDPENNKEESSEIEALSSEESVSELKAEPESAEAPDTDENAEEPAEAEVTEAAEVAENKLQRLRIVFAGMDGRFSTTPLQVLAQAHDIVGIIHSKPRRVKGSFLNRWLKSGKSDGNLERFAKHYGCPYISIDKEYNYDLVMFVKHLKPDIICVSNFSVILPPDVFEIPRYGAVNLHLASLPEYRGPNPWLWMLYDGCTENKYVVHQIDAGEDTGPILAEGDFNIPPNVSCSELADCVLPNASCLMMRVLEDIASGKAKPKDQPYKENLRRARYVKPGEQIINWNEWDCEKVSSFLQGACIWYEPFSIFPGLVRIYQPAVKGDSKGKPGTNHFRLWKGWISCKDGIVPYKIGISRYEFWHMFMPFFLIILIYLIL